jgi:two-component sensor histidine kinase
LFSVVIAVARETRHGKAPDDFLEAFGQRVVALARSHDLLVTGDWQGTSFRELLTHHLEPFGAVERSEIDGPNLPISSFAAQYLGMAFHELATNAAKYGALSTPTGKIRVAWEVSSKDRLLLLNWRESGSVPPDQHGATTGFGTKVLSQLVPAALSGESTLTLLPDGLMWTLTAPWSAIVNRSENEPERKGS